MFPEDNNNSRSPSRKRWFFLPPSCFVGSLVSETGGSDRPGGPSTVSKPKLSRFSWSRIRKKKKTVPLDGAPPNIEQASAHKISPSEKPSKGRTSRSGSNAKQLQRDAVTQLHPGINLHQPHLPRISTQHRTCSGAAPPSWELDPGRGGSKTSHAGSPGHIHTAASNKIPVRTGSLEPAAGLWIMVVTLAVMVFFGRVSAVICLCFCFYIAPLLSVVEDDGSSREGVGSREVDMDSGEYKKRVILEGLLERNGRKPSGFLVAMGALQKR
ncbi:uncharacterized protein LOC113463036 [Phoenix dactylifera]|uniref:Uncharacterized protein LOC113463036 n=1 Tax=Phoenix dactylifera TaxID=42345 RepID=A0A8B8J7Q4_PHODC|nr:uncharacterized protein LOC113463036 [Phoenix dactylifera]